MKVTIIIRTKINPIPRRKPHYSLIRQNPIKLSSIRPDETAPIACIPAVQLKANQIIRIHLMRSLSISSETFRM